MEWGRVLGSNPKANWNQLGRLDQGTRSDEGLSAPPSLIQIWNFEVTPPIHPPTTRSDPLVRRLNTLGFQIGGSPNGWRWNGVEFLDRTRKQTKINWGDSSKEQDPTRVYPPHQAQSGFGALRKVGQSVGFFAVIVKGLGVLRVCEGL
ncbi:BTB/POZ domain-containing protein [Pyrus ussuriensis x Pyrus communis]|uniref:BTB/POZ domain-containing protein n=1 Tax=Pyrus ussuriensis x Pyrus communis TaxID=2448454 RepID=A0A5N5GHA2_9ROSA|nr:BTB/POZ domain-containing protein [Pyrus ussuriensis x Pyrus communis]